MNVHIKNLQKKRRIDKKYATSLIAKVGRFLNLTKKTEISVVFVNNKIIQKYNKIYLKHNYPTDVIAFTLSYANIRKNITVTGDILINIEFALKNAPVYKNTFKKELSLYIIHGMLHLIGYNDQRPIDKKLIQKYQKKLLNKI